MTTLSAILRKKIAIPRYFSAIGEQAWARAQFIALSCACLTLKTVRTLAVQTPLFIF